MRKHLALEILERLLKPMPFNRWTLGLFLRRVPITANEGRRNEPWKMGIKALISNKHNTAVKQDTEKYEEHA